MSEPKNTAEENVCKMCGGSGVVDDGEITGSGGIEFENGPIKCVKDCPDCVAPKPAQESAAAVIPAGWKLVPIEPTFAMLDRAVTFALNVRIGGEYRWKNYMVDLWSGFLASAPQDVTSPLTMTLNPYATPLAMEMKSAQASTDEGAVAKIHALFQPTPTDEPESQYRFGYNTALGDVIAILTTPQPAQPDAPVRTEALRKGLFEARDAMRVMSNWAKKSDPAGHSWAVRMMDRASAVLNGESSTAQADAPAHAAECPHCDGEGVIEGDSGTSPCACQRDAQEGMPTFGARRAQADAPAEARERDDPELIAASNKGYAAGLRDGKALGACGPLAPADAGEAAAWRYRTSGDNWCYCDGDPVHVCDRDYEKQPLYTAPPAARVASLTNSQREAIEFAAKTMEARMLNAHACVLRALLNGADKS
ncbi:gp42 domain protein [Burkholderia pseudomallei MSHR7334]|uniref:hypothetical protein n=1 Tax=Burkholderia pseudomallei TaxID=28450 RepID=UPI000530DE50|nr:hypothetical protein [Burkholderia pseudomallei]KGS75376.1 gp42 domain protein [Burkholderia pseudomallei MSHR7334]